MRLLLEGETLTSVARRMGLTQPAVSQRIRKISEVFEAPLVEREGRRVRLTQRGRAICTQAEAALAVMGDVSPRGEAPELRIGTRPEVGLSWLWPALERLRSEHPELTFHCFFGSGEDIIRRLAAGDLEVILTSAPQPLAEYQSRDLVEERYVLVTDPERAARLGTWEDLAGEVLVEHDPSFPFLRYLPPEERARLRFRQAWFVGSSELMVRALERGHGVGIVAEYLAREALEAGRLVRIFPEVPLESDHFRLVSRRGRRVEAAVENLAATLVDLGLR